MYRYQGGGASTGTKVEVPGTGTKVRVPGTGTKVVRQVQVPRRYRAKMNICFYDHSSTNKMYVYDNVIFL